VPYTEFFRRICGFDPYPFQVRFHDCEAAFRVLEAPTGLGKTRTVIADWLSGRSTTRLVYCLPGRALTRQVAHVARGMVPEDVKVFELMGGSEDIHEKIRPDQPAIIVGTQDVLVSRALNRGYALSPFRWPMDFGLLNNDVTWVFDEVQLLGEVVATGAQLAAFRKQLGTYGRAKCVWMTATLDRGWLKTADFSEEPAVIRLEADDLQRDDVNGRVTADKALAEATACDVPAECAAFVAKQHKENYLTLVIANTVVRAQEIWTELQRLKVVAKILHSRFRPCDRERTVDEILKIERGVIVSTQVIEAGVDINADLMITDVAPWASMVQRFGRVNRDGKKPHARIYWVRNPQRGKKAKLDGSQYLPYEANEVQKAIAELEKLRSAAPAGLAGRIAAPVPYRYVLRRSDLLDLFDTTPDLAGNQIDVSRFVRSGEETNVYVGWRSWPKEQEPFRRRFERDELCPVPFFPGKSDFKDWLKKNDAWSWNYAKKGRWEKVDPNRMYAGMRLLVRSEAGGYTSERGWLPESKAAVPDWQPGREAQPIQEEPSMDSDEMSETTTKGLAQHTDEVVEGLCRLLEGIKVDLNGATSSLQRAARLHDWGKAHPIFQQTLHLEDLGDDPPDPLLAKQDRKKSRSRGHSRPGFRHELASALASLDAEEFLTAYLVAAHHGKVRMSIRSFGGEKARSEDIRVARGIQDSDTLFTADLGGGECMPEITLTLGAMDLGKNGWSDQAAKLLQAVGPFRLAYLELLLRAADERASEEGAQ